MLRVSDNLAVLDLKRNFIGKMCLLKINRFLVENRKRRLKLQVPPTLKSELIHDTIYKYFYDEVGNLTDMKRLSSCISGNHKEKLKSDRGKSLLNLENSTANGRN